MTIKQNNQFTAIDFRYLKDDALAGGTGAEVDNAFGTSGKLYFIYANNTDTSGDTGYLKLYDTNLPITEGTTVPDFEFKIVADTAVADGLHVFNFPEGLTFSSGFGYTISTAAGTTAGSALSPDLINLLFVFK